MWGIAVVTSQVCAGVEAALTRRMLRKTKTSLTITKWRALQSHLRYCASTCVLEHSQNIVSSRTIDWNFPNAVKDCPSDVSWEHSSFVDVAFKPPNTSAHRPYVSAKEIADRCFSPEVPLSVFVYLSRNCFVCYFVLPTNIDSRILFVGARHPDILVTAENHVRSLELQDGGWRRGLQLHPLSW